MQNVSATLPPEIPHYTPRAQKRYRAPEGFDLNDIMAFTAGQPHDYFHKLRRDAPVSWWDFGDGASLTGYWALTRYEDIKSCDMDAARFSSQQGGILTAYNLNSGPKRLAAAALNNLICLDQPFHMPLRMEHRPFFTSHFAGELAKRVEGEVDRLLDNVEKAAAQNGGLVDFAKVFSENLPLYTLCEMLGVDEADRPKIVRWMHYLELAGYIINDPENKVTPLFVAQFYWNLRQMFRYGEKVLKDRRRKPRNDLLSLIANTDIDGAPMNQDFLDGSWLLIIFAGNDTTRNSLSGTMRLLTQFPDQKHMLLDDPSLMPKLVPEALRLVSPVMYMRRTALEDAEFSGQPIAKGEKVVMWFGAANRDPEIFADPDTMDIHRENARDHIAFGRGAHVCLGKHIAIMQLETAYRRILDRFPDIEWTGKQSHAPNNFVHAISSLEVKLGKPHAG